MDRNGNKRFIVRFFALSTVASLKWHILKLLKLLKPIKKKKIKSYGHSKVGGTQKTPKFQKPITRPLGHPEPKNFVFPSFTLGDTSTPKMSKIGEIRVLSYLHLSWNAPKRRNGRRRIQLLHSSHDFHIAIRVAQNASELQNRSFWCSIRGPINLRPVFCSYDSI